MASQGSNRFATPLRTVVWIFASILFLDTSYSTLRQLQARGLPVSPWRYVQVAFWVVILVFWIVTGIRLWLARRAVNRTEVEVLPADRLR